MNCVLMYTHCGCLSLFLKTTRRAYTNWVLSGLVAHIELCVSPLEGVKCRFIFSNNVTHASVLFNN